MEDLLSHSLIIYNDDENSFEYIMSCLITFCGHNLIQAEQCALIAHNNGKCSVKTGDFLKLYELQNLFENVNIKTEIANYESNMY